MVHLPAVSLLDSIFSCALVLGKIFLQMSALDPVKAEKWVGHTESINLSEIDTYQGWTLIAEAFGAVL